MLNHYAKNFVLKKEFEVGKGLALNYVRPLGVISEIMHESGSKFNIVSKITRLKISSKFMHNYANYAHWPYII